MNEKVPVFESVQVSVPPPSDPNDEKRDDWHAQPFGNLFQTTVMGWVSMVAGLYFFLRDHSLEKQLHPLLMRLGIPRGGFHSMRHGAASALLADGATPAVVQKQLRHSDPRITLGIYGQVVGNQQRDAVENRSARIAKFAA